MERRMAEKNDIQALASFRMEYFDDAYGDKMSREDRESLYAENLQIIEEELNKTLFITLCMEEDRIVSTAYMTVTRMAANMRCRHGLYGEIYGVYTAPDHRLKGLAYGNINLLLNVSKELGLSYVGLEASPEGAYVYVKNGFKDDEGTYRRMEFTFEKGVVL